MWKDLKITEDNNRKLEGVIKKLGKKTLNSKLIFIQRVSVVILYVTQMLRKSYADVTLMLRKCYANVTLN